MGKLIVTKFSDHQHRVVKKRPGKSIKRCASGKPPKSKKSRKQPLPAVPASQKLEDVENPSSEYQDLRTEVGKSPDSGRSYLKLVQPICDLFADDELKARYDQYTKHNLIFVIFDEISLEGLDGITIEALWKRIEHNLRVEKMLENLKEVIWQIICLNEQITFFELPEARPELVIYNNDERGPDIYKVAHPARNSGQWGSCSDIDTRIDISEKVRKISLDEAINTYGNKLVLVAVEELRKNALLDDLMDPNYDYTVLEYCLLERIGRARGLGEITLGPMAISTTVKLDPKSIYHYCKRLRKEYLVSTQYCSVSCMEQLKVGRLLHLRRFYRKEKPAYLILMETIVNYLKKCPGYRAPYPSIRALLKTKASGKFFKHHDFLNFIDTNIYVPFKEYYTEATIEQYMIKSKARERIIQLMQLKDPYVNLVACWGDGQNPDSSDDEDEDADTNSNVNQGRRIYNKDMIRDVYQHILSKGVDGISVTDLLGVFDVDFPAMRAMLKKLKMRKLVDPKKIDVGKQTVNQFVAVCLLENQDIKISPVLGGMGSSTAIEKLKQRQKRKIDSLPKERIYTLDQFETDREDQLLSLDTPMLPQIGFQIPQIICQYIISVVGASESLQGIIDISLVKFIEPLKPFKINLTFPAIAYEDNSLLNLKKISIGAIENQQIKLGEYMGEFCVKNFKPDNFSQAFLMQALLENVKINRKEVIDFLDENKAKQAEKRSIEPKEKVCKKIKVEDDAAVPVGGLGIHLGSNPILVLTDKDEASGFHTEIFMSTPLEEYKTGDITEYVSNPAMVITDRVASRTAFILKTVQEQRIVDEMHTFLKLIYQEEKAAGYDKRIDRKSLHRIFKTLTNEGYLRVYSMKLTKVNTKKQQIFVCHPDVTFDHPILQEKFSQVTEKAYCYINKKEEEKIESIPETPYVIERSPFVEDDVLRSIKEIKDLTTQPLKAKSCKKSGKFYGRRPKFARLALMHELLFYLIYELNKNTQPLPIADVANLFSNHQIKLTEADLKNLPPVYCREISWKTFIPPLPSHMGWGEGWALLVDVILRFPITLITRSYSVNFVSAELQDILLHPIKRFYLLKHVSSNIRTIVMYRRKFIHDMYNQLVLLAYCGLCQFGAASFHDKEKSFFYLNRRASLWDTTSSKPGYQKIEDKEYPKLSFYFNKMENVLKYWSTMNSICIHTKLSSKLAVAGKTITLVHSTAKPSLNKVRTIRTQDEVQQYDTGELPGDHEGAAGLDCSMWSHIQRSWYFFATKKDPCFTESLDTLKLGQVANKRVAFDQLKLHSTVSNKYYIPKPQQLKPATRKTQGTSIGKNNAVIKRTMPVIWRKPPSQKKEGLDAVDKALLRKCSSVRYRPIWTEDEDKLLILLKIASVFITPGTNKQIISYATLRDVLHIFEPKTRDKTSRSLSNRLKILSRSVPILSNIESLIPNLYKLVPIAKYFVPFRKFVLYGTDTRGFNRKFKLSDPELHNAFIFLVHYFMTHRKEVEVSLHGRNTSTDYFNGENLDFFEDNIEPFDKKERYYSEPECEADIRKSALKNTIQSALAHKTDKPAWSLQTYKIYQQFSEDVLRAVLYEMRSQRMIQSKKNSARTFFAPYRLSVYYVFSQSTSFWFNTMEEAYKTFLDLKYSPSELDYSYDEEKTYGQMFAMNELLSFMLDDVTFDFKFPEYHLILNPEVKDHSDVIDELANRYQAKLKNEQKGVDVQTDLQASSKIEEDEAEIPEPVPGPSTAEPEKSTIEAIPYDDDELLDLSITAKNSTTIDNLKHWISDCIDTERVRSPSPELLNLEVSQEPEQGETAEEKSTPTQEEDRLLTLEEIKEEMLKRYDDKVKPVVPYISDLTRLLNENFEDIENDDRAYYLLKNHFVQQYPSVEKINFNGLDGHYLSEHFENRSAIKDVWVRVEKEAFIDIPSDKGVAFDDILAQSGSIEDISVAYEVLQFIESKTIYGAPGYEIKEKFSSYATTCSLELLVKILANHNIIIRVGVCSVRFVYHKYLNPWLTDTFTLTAEQVSAFPDTTAKSGEDLQKLEADIRGINITKWIKIKAMPWAMADGILNKDMLKMWLSHVFSYCIENPKITFNALCDKFCFLKPFDIFYLVEVLEELGAVEIRRLTIDNVDCFSEYDFPKDCKATALDRFEEMYIDLNNVGFTTLGSFFHNL